MKIMKIDNQIQKQTRPNFQAKHINLEHSNATIKTLTDLYPTLKELPQELAKRSDVISKITVNGKNFGYEFVNPTWAYFSVLGTHGSEPKKIQSVMHHQKSVKEVADSVVEAIKLLSQNFTK
jgi:hypothetical protein